MLETAELAMRTMQPLLLQVESAAEGRSPELAWRQRTWELAGDACAQAAAPGQQGLLPRLLAAAGALAARQLDPALRLCQLMDQAALRLRLAGSSADAAASLALLRGLADVHWPVEAVQRSVAPLLAATHPGLAALVCLMDELLAEGRQQVPVAIAAATLQAGVAAEDLAEVSLGLGAPCAAVVHHLLAQSHG